MEIDGASARLNSSQTLHLLTSAQYADKLLSEIESVLSASRSKTPFRRYKGDLSPTRVKVIEDYLARIRAQLVRMLEGQGIDVPEPDIESIHSIRTALAFAKIAFRDCTPDRMRGYGQIQDSKARDLNGLVNEMESVLDKLDYYLAQGLGQDFKGRLEKLNRSGGDVTTVKAIERIIRDHGLVEFRSTLSMIIDRLESTRFEIALFGRVSSGKSSLLNAIVEAEILPVGVNPVTTVPTRLVYGTTPRMTVWYADKNSEQLESDTLPDFVTEELNPANIKRVTKIVVELPSPHLRDGVMFVDTPGLGSLATSGAVETLAYLPRCDLGVVLIDAGSTLTEDDLSTIRALYDAGVPASILLSKSDLLTDDDRAQALSYVARHLGTQLGISLTPYPVSARSSYKVLLESWLDHEIFPLYERHQQLSQESLGRKIGALREAVETALRIRLERPARKSALAKIDIAGIDARLRNASSRFAEAQKICSDIAHEIEEFAERGLAVASSRLVASWPGDEAASATTVVRSTLTDIAAARATLIAGALEDLTCKLAEALQDAGRDLGFSDGHYENDLTSVLKEMPRLDLGSWDVNVAPSFWLNISLRMETRRVEQRLREQIGDALSKTFYNFGKILDAWTRRTLADLQLQFDSHADGYRAHLDRLRSNGRASEAEQAAIQRDLNRLTQSQTSMVAEINVAS